MRVFHFYILIGGFFLLSCNSNPEKKDAEPKGEVIREQLPQTEESQNSGRDDLKSPEKTFLIGDRAAGEFRLGSPIPESHKALTVTKVHHTRITDGGPTDETVYLVKEGDSAILSILPDIDPKTGKTTGDIGELRISSEKYKTAKGIGVGSTLNEFIDQYPDYKIWYTYVSNMYVVETEEVKAQFLLKEEDFLGEMKITSEITPLKKEDFREEAKIRKIRLF